MQAVDVSSSVLRDSEMQTVVFWVVMLCNLVDGNSVSVERIVLIFRTGDRCDKFLIHIFTAVKT
jgi:hypothetical protein